MAPKEKKTKAQIMAAASAGGKAKKKKWSKGKQRDKLNNSVIMDKPTYDKLMAEIPKCKLVTPALVSERLRITVSLARQAILALEQQKKIKRVGEPHHAQMIFTRAVAEAGDE